MLLSTMQHIRGKGAKISTSGLLHENSARALFCILAFPNKTAGSPLLVIREKSENGIFPSNAPCRGSGIETMQLGSSLSIFENCNNI